MRTRKDKDTGMKQEVQMLVLNELFTVFRYVEEIVNVEHWPQLGDDYTKKLKEPNAVSRAAGVCRAWHEKVKARRTAVLLKAVGDYVHFCMLGSVLHLADIDMYGIYPGDMRQTEVPLETRDKMAVWLGSREMYAVEAVRRTIEPAGDGVPWELVVQSCMRGFTDKPARTCTHKGIAVHRVCCVHEDVREPAEQKEFDEWHNAAYERLGMLFDLSLIHI